MTHFAFLSELATLSQALFAEVATLLQDATADACRALATSEPFVAAAEACTGTIDQQNTFSTTLPTATPCLSEPWAPSATT